VAIYGLLRTAESSSALVSAATRFHISLGHVRALTVLALFLVYREIAHGPSPRGDRLSGMATWFCLLAFMGSCT